jgi:hypothetical protein
MKLIPKEILTEILTKLENDELYVAQFVCREWILSIKILVPKFIEKYTYSDDMAAKGYLDVLVWAYQNGCELNEQAYYSANVGNLKIYNC